MPPNTIIPFPLPASSPLVLVLSPSHPRPRRLRTLLLTTPYSVFTTTITLITITTIPLSTTVPSLAPSRYPRSNPRPHLWSPPTAHSPPPVMSVWSRPAATGAWPSPSSPLSEDSRCSCSSLLLTLLHSRLPAPDSASLKGTPEHSQCVPRRPPAFASQR